MGYEKLEYEKLTQQGMLRKSEIVSIRIDPELCKKLHEKSNEQKISLNTLINHLLEKQVNWNELANEIGWVSIFRSVFREMMESISKEKIIKIGQTAGKTDLQNSLNYFYGRIDLDSILDFLKKQFQSMKVQFRLISENGKDRIIIQHDLGKNWPHLVISELNELLNTMGYKITNDEYNKSGFSFEIIRVEVF